MMPVTTTATASNINPLSNPKGVTLICELCQKPAFIQCTGCNVTYYCNSEHQASDWAGIHEKICKLVIPLRGPKAFISTEEQRAKRKKELTQLKTELLGLTQRTGEKLLFEGQHKLAIPAAMQALKFSIDLYSLASVELVPPYLLLGEANIGLGDLDQAEEYLAQAQWTVLKTPECSNKIRYKLFRILGLLYAAKGEYEEAKRYFADDIFHASLAYNPEDVHTAGGYFHMANVFFREGKMEIVDSMYEKVLNIWHKYLTTLVHKKLNEAKSAEEQLFSDIETSQKSVPSIDEAQEAEAKKIIHAIHDYHEQDTKGGFQLAITVHSLAMLYFLLGDFNTARHHSSVGLEHLGRIKVQQEKSSDLDIILESELSKLNRESLAYLQQEQENQEHRHTFFESHDDN